MSVSPRELMQALEGMERRDRLRKRTQAMLSKQQPHAGPAPLAAAGAGRHATSNPNLLSCDDLQDITGYKRPSDIERCLIEQGVKVFRGRLGPWTTLDLINQAGGLRTKADNDDHYPPDII